MSAEIHRVACQSACQDYRCIDGFAINGEPEGTYFSGRRFWRFLVGLPYLMNRLHSLSQFIPTGVVCSLAFAENRLKSPGLLSRLTVLANSKMSLILSVNFTASEHENRIRQHCQDCCQRGYRRMYSIVENRSMMQMEESAFLPLPERVIIDRIQMTETQLTVIVVSMQPFAHYPGCCCLRTMPTVNIDEW